MDTSFFLPKERMFPGVHKIGAPISGPRIADTISTDTGIFLIYETQVRTQSCERIRDSSPSAVLGMAQRSIRGIHPEPVFAGVWPPCHFPFPSNTLARRCGRGW